MRISIFNWRDIEHPRSGGAEVATDQLARGLVARGHEVTFFTSTYAGAAADEMRSGYRIVRRGSEYTCRLYGLLWLWRQRNTIDIVIDEVNTIPFLSRLIVPKKHVVWMHQLVREGWVMAPPVIRNIGYLSEPLMFSIYRNARMITISQSSAQSFRDHGLKGPIHVAEIALRPPAEDAPLGKERFHIGYVGRIVPTKRLDHVLRAVQLLLPRFPQLHLTLVGTGTDTERKKLERIASERDILQRITFTGWISESERDRLMASFDVLVMTGVREGWGLVVSEAARYGVPSVVYPVAGLVDSVKNGETGIICEREEPDALAQALTKLLDDPDYRDRLGRNAREYIRLFTEERFIGTFERALYEQKG